MTTILERAPMIFLAVAEAVNNTSSDLPTQIGVGGIVALLIIREFIAYSKGKKITNGYQKAATCEQIVLRFDKNFESQDKRFDKVDVQLDEVKTLIVKNGN